LSAAVTRPGGAHGIAIETLCIDVGGRSRLLVMDERGRLTKFKASTTPSDPTQA